MDDKMELKAQDFDNNEDTPEKRLLRSVFFRALADLSPHVEKSIRRETIQWFEEKDDGVPADEKGCFSFHDICCALDIDKGRIKKIMERVEEAKNNLHNHKIAVKGYSFKSQMYGKYENQLIC